MQNFRNSALLTKTTQQALNQTALQRQQVSQMINKATNFINESSSFIDLIFSSNTSFIKNCESEVSIYQKCHHNIICRTLNIPLPPPHSSDV